MINRRQLLKLCTRYGAAATTMPVWMKLATMNANAQTSSGYKAIICISLAGGNDGNNTLIPLDPATFAEYTSVRKNLALPQSTLIPVQTRDTGTAYGFHPNLPNISSLFTQGLAEVVANCGPMSQPLTKTALKANSSLLPQSFGSHPVSQAQWESASTVSAPATGWGGRIADQVAGQSGSVAPLLSLSGITTFSIGNSTQGVAMIQGSAYSAPFPSSLTAPTINIANLDAQSQNQLVHEAAQIKSNALQTQTILQQCQQAGSGFSTQFPTSTLGQNLQTIVQLINGRQVVGPTRQLFYVNVLGYDTHATQLGTHATLLSDLDSSVGALITALQEIGMLNNVAVVTVSDFGRTMEPNTSSGSDHAWGNHQFVFGGGFKGGRVLGSMPDFVIGGSQDWTGQGVWIPTTATTQIVAGVANWFGLNSTQVATVCPNLSSFPSGAISL